MREQEQREQRIKDMEDALRLLRGDVDHDRDQLEMRINDPRRAPDPHARAPSRQSIRTRRQHAEEQLIEKLLPWLSEIASDNARYCRCQENGPRCLHAGTIRLKALAVEAAEYLAEFAGVGLVLVHDDDVGAA